MVFITELMIFMVLETMALRRRISEKNHASQNRRETDMVFLKELMIFMVLAGAPEQDFQGKTCQPEPSLNSYGFPYRINDFYGFGHHDALEQDFQGKTCQPEPSSNRYGFP